MVEDRLALGHVGEAVYCCAEAVRATWAKIGAAVGAGMSVRPNGGVEQDGIRVGTDDACGAAVHFFEES